MMRLGIALVSLLFACATGRAETLRVAYDQDLPPYSKAIDAQPQGLAVDALRAAAAKAGIELVLSPVPFEQGPRIMDTGAAQAYFPLAITPERRQVYDFSAPLVVTGGALYMLAPQVPPETLSELAGKTVVTPRTGPLAAFIARTAPEIKLVVTTDYEDSLARLVRGEAVAAALNDLVGVQIADRLYPGKVVRSKGRFLELPLALAVLKGTQADLLTRLNAALTAR